MHSFGMASLSVGAGKGLAEQLALAFGRPDAMSALYAEDVEWHLPASTTIKEAPFRGREAVTTFNRSVDTRYEAKTVKVEILMALQEGDLSAVRLLYSANMLPTGEPYSNEYNLFVRSCHGKITEVYEGLDTFALQLARGTVRPV